MGRLESSHMEYAFRIVRELWKETDGQDLVEYSLLLAFIALGTVALLGSTKTSLISLWSKIGSTLSSTATSAAS
jgi:Flp pilus assembly pilin Flp